MSQSIADELAEVKAAMTDAAMTDAATSMVSIASNVDAIAQRIATLQQSSNLTVEDRAELDGIAAAAKDLQAKRLRMRRRRTTWLTLRHPRRLNG